MSKIKGFIKSERVYQILTAAVKSKENCILYGKGGYGKSEMSTAFLHQIGIPKEEIAIKALSVGTNVDDLFGGVNMKVLSETGEIQYNVEHSIFSKRIIILEEAFDAPVRVLESLKDTLTSKQIRNGNQIYDIKTETIIVCTNRSKKDLVENDSTAALMERFPLVERVYWETHNLEDYKELFDTVAGKNDDPTLAKQIIEYVLKSIKEDPSFTEPSPRAAVKMMKIVSQADIESLQFMDDIPHADRAYNALKFEKDKMAQRRLYNQALTELRKKKQELLGVEGGASFLEVTRFQTDSEKILTGFKKFVSNKIIQKDLSDLVDFSAE